jgi:hypothetical protein
MTRRCREDPVRARRRFRRVPFLRSRYITDKTGAAHRAVPGARGPGRTRPSRQTPHELPKIMS